MPKSSKPSKDHFNCLVRKVEAIRGDCKVCVECFPSFDYARAQHEAFVKSDEQTSSKGIKRKSKVNFVCSDVTFELRCFSNSEKELDHELYLSNISFDGKEHHSKGALALVRLKEKQCAYFVFGKEIEEKKNQTVPLLNFNFFQSLFYETYAFWQSWISKSSYTGRWRECVNRSILTLKLLTYDKTGAVVAAPTFSLPENLGGGRNWDYRFTWIRDSSFTIYAFIRVGFTEEAEQYMKYIEDLLDNMSKDGSLNIMYTIEGHNLEKEEEVLEHFDGYKSSRPVRIGNSASGHLQLDIYGELMDAVYLYNKYGSQISYDMWLKVMKIVEYVCDNYDVEDMSIWEVRNKKQHFLYSKIMCWVAIDRGIRLSEKRSFPCPNKNKWIQTKDNLYMEIMDKGYNFEQKHFCQSYESKNSIDASSLIMPMVFFISPTDPRFINTLNKILMPPEKGGLCLNNLVYRYHPSSNDGINEEEGSFSMCTFWLVEALTRAGKYKPEYLDTALNIFEQMIGYSNHLNLYSEEIRKSGESLGNFPQAFTHIALVSAAFNLDRVLSKNA